MRVSISVFLLVIANGVWVTAKPCHERTQKTQLIVGKTFPFHPLSSPNQEYPQFSGKVNILGSCTFELRNISLSKLPSGEE